jgi:hypothetical protein
MRIFISYSGRHRYDGEVADSIAAALAVSEIDYFLDRQSIQVGDDILTTIKLAIEKSCSHLLILASFASTKVEWLHQELELAVQHGLVLIPMVIAARENEIPELVRGLKTLFAPLRREVATLYEHLGLGTPPDPDKAKQSETAPEFLPVLCDRKDEQTLFEQAFDDSEQRVAGAPKFYCLIGDFRARHDLFVARLREGMLATSARFLSGAVPGAPDTVRVAEVNWPVKWPARHGVKPLIESLFRQLNPAVPVRQLDEVGLAALVAGLRESVVVVTHPMPTARWLPETTKRLADYLSLWRDAAGLMRKADGAGKPLRKEVIVLLTVSWPRIVDQTLHDRLETAISEIESKTGRSRTMPLFTPIRFSTVNEAIIEEWANRFTDKPLAVRTKKYCRDLFQAATELQLGEVIDQFYEALGEQQEKSA